jgi:hypothetical protein
VEEGQAQKGSRKGGARTRSRGEQRSHGGHGGTRRANDGARPWPSQAVVGAQGPQQHHGGARGHAKASSSSATTRARRLARGHVTGALRKNGGGGEKQIDADQSKRRRTAVRLIPISPPAVAGVGRINSAMAAATTGRQSTGED